MIQKKWKTFKRKNNIKITKPQHSFKDFASTYNVETLTCSNPELQLKDIESAVKGKLIELLTQLKGFKFMTKLVLVSKKIESEDKRKCDNSYASSKAEIIINESHIDDMF